MKATLLVIGMTLAALVGGGAYLAIQQSPDSTPLPGTRPNLQVPSVSVPPTSWEKVQPHLVAADKASDAAVKKHCDRLSQFFEERRKRARPFAEESLSFWSKWAFAKSKLPFTDEDGHRKYLHEQFEEIVFSNADLEEAIQSSVRGCMAELQGIENDLLVKIRADIGDDALGVMKGKTGFSPDAALREQYSRAIEKAGKAMVSDLPVWGGREAVTWVGADLSAPIIKSLATSLIARLGLSGTVLGSGAASGVITLGGGIVAGFIIDAILDRLLLALGYDPAADIEAQVIETLRNTEQLILQGEGLAKTADKKGGLVYHLSTLSKERTKLRNAAIKQLVLEGGVQ